MIPFMVVDDEHLERVLILKSYNWEEQGFKLVAQAGDGEEGFAHFLQHRPQLVITDINMPYVDGLAMARKIKETAPQTEVVILTGFDEFAYAQKAVNIGVDSFLLKPIKRQDLAQAAQKAKDKIEQRQQTQQQAQQVQSQLQQSMRESFLQRLVAGRVSQLEFEEYTAEKALAFLSGPVYCVYAKGGPPPALKTPGGWAGICFDFFAGGTVLLAAPGAAAHSPETLAAAMPAGQNLYIGISALHSGIDGIALAFRQAEEGASAQEIIGQPGCALYSQIFGNIQDTGQAAQAASLMQQYCNHMRAGQWQAASQAGAQCLEAMTAASQGNLGMLRMALFRILSAGANILLELGSLPPDHMEEDMLKTAVQVTTTSQALAQIERLAVLGAQGSDALPKGAPNSKLVENVLRHVQAHFCDAQLSLKTIAREMYLNDSYLSRVFKKEMQKGLSEYILELRIQMACQLLQDPEVKNYEVAERVGINDPHYFGQCFKKQMGLTVGEYRKGLGR